MGNRQMNGFGVVNETDDDVTIGLSMGATHYFENNVGPGEQFYRQPGAVHYTVFAYNTAELGEMKIKHAAGEVARATLVGAGTCAVAGVSIAASVVLVVFETAAVGALAIAWRAARSGAGFFGAAIGRPMTILDRVAGGDYGPGWQYVDRKGCYGGRRGTWMRLIRATNGNYQLEDVDYRYCEENGRLTEESRAHFNREMEKME